MSTLDRLKELQAAATPGPWEAKQNSWDTSTIYDSHGDGIIRCKIRPHDEDPYDMLAEEPHANADIIALLYNNADDLLAVVEAAKLYLMACDNLHDTDSGSKAEWIAGFLADEKEKALRDALAKLEKEEV